jgi:cold shock CspA family protein
VRASRAGPHGGNLEIDTCVDCNEKCAAAVDNPILHRDAGKDLFVHHSDIAGDGFKSLQEGAKVAFDSEPGDKGCESGQRPQV